MSSPRNTIPDPEKRPISPPTAGLAAAAKCPPVGTTCFIPETLEIFEARVDLNSNVVFARDQDTHQLLAFSDAIAIAWDQQLYLEMIHNEIQATGSGVREIFDAADRDGGWFDDLATRIEGRLSNESTFMADFLRNIFLPLLIDGLSGTDPSTEKVAAVLGDFIHPDLSKLGDNTAIGLGRIKDAIAEATATEDFRSFDTATLLLQRLDELVDATKGSGGQPIDEWIEDLTPHSDPRGAVAIAAIETLTGWLKMPKGMPAFMTQFLVSLLPAAVAGLSVQQDVPQKLLKPIIEKVLDQIQKRVRDTGEVSPAQAFDVAANFLTDAITAGVEANFLATSMELAGPAAKALGFTQITGLISELAAFGPIAAGTWGRAISEGVGRPAEYQVNSIMRPQLPGESQLKEAARQRKLNLLSMKSVLEFHGYSQRWIDMIQSSMWQTPNLREIVMLAGDTSVTEADVEMWLTEGGYSDADIRTQIPVVMQQSVKAQRQSLTAEVLANLKEGFLSEEDAEAQFDRLRYTEEAKRLLFDTGRLGFRREIMQGQITELEQMFQLGQIMEPEFRLALSALGVHKAKIAGIVGKAVSKFEGRVSKEEQAQVDKDVREFQTASLAALKAQFQEHLIAAETFFSNLVAIGFVPAIAREVVSLEELRLLAKEKSASEADADRLRQEIIRARMAAFIDFFRDDFINERELRAGLIGLGLTQELADAIVLREAAFKLEQPKPAPPPTRH